MHAVLQRHLQPIASEAMLDELKDVLSRPKFVGRLKLVGKTVEQLMGEYASQVEVVDVPPIGKAISDDPDDDEFIACALAGNAQIIVSGDQHLLKVRWYQGILILTAAEMLERI